MFSNLLLTLLRLIRIITTAYQTQTSPSTTKIILRLIQTHQRQIFRRRRVIYFYLISVLLSIRLNIAQPCFYFDLWKPSKNTYRTSKKESNKVSRITLSSSNSNQNSMMFDLTAPLSKHIVTISSNYTTFPTHLTSSLDLLT